MRNNKILYAVFFVLLIAVLFFVGCSDISGGSEKHDSVDYYLYEDYPSVTLLTSSSMKLTVKTKIDTTVYYLVLEEDGVTPTTKTIQYGLDGNGNENVPASGHFSSSADYENTIEITGLTESQSYYLYLAAANSGDEISKLHQVGFESGSLAPDLNDIPVDQGLDGVTIYWIDNSNFEDGFVIQRSTSENFTDYDVIYLTGEDTSEYLDTEYTADSFNYYRIASYRDIQGTRYFSDFSEYSGRYCVDTEFDYDFSFVFLPDTQFYSDYPTLNEVFYTQNEWLADNAESMGFKFVAGLGDIVDDWSDEDEWVVADKAYGYFDDAGTPYGVCRGNHDSPTSYVKYFPASRWQDSEGNYPDYYGGHSDNGLNSYFIVEADGQDFLFLFVDYTSSYADMNWIEGVLTDHPTTPTILVDHIFLEITNNTLEPSEVSVSYDWILSDLIEPYPQIFMTYCGHNHGSGYMTLQNNQGWDVLAMLCDYQMGYRQGNGWIRFMNFNMEEGIIQGVTYSPYVASMSYEDRAADGSEDETFLTESSYYSDHQFKINFDMTGFISNLENLN